MSAVLTRIPDLSDLELDVKLTIAYKQHRGAGADRRKVLHRIIVEILAEQKTRRDQWLADFPALVRG